MTPNEIITQAQIDTVRKYISEFANETQFALAFVKDSTVQYVGIKRTADSLHFIDNKDSVFEIGSISKVFTSTLLAYTAISGKIGIDDPIVSALPYSLKESEKDGKVISYKTLANHTSGLPRLPDGMMWNAITNPDNPYKDYDQTKLENYLKNDMKLNAIPGTKNEYSNLGAGLLGNVLEQVNGMSYEQQLQQKIFQPLAMSQTTTYREQVEKMLVKGRNQDGEITANWDLNSLKAAGAILSSVQDLQKFALANFTSDSVLAFQRQKTFQISDFMDIALGWHIMNTKAGNQWHWHNGGTGGYRSFMGIDVKDKYGIIVLSNVSGLHSESGKIDQLGFSLMKTLRESE